eukprot:2135732-Amphidinium_carterae.1
MTSHSRDRSFWDRSTCSQPGPRTLGALDLGHVRDVLETGRSAAPDGGLSHPPGVSHRRAHLAACHSGQQRGVGSHVQGQRVRSHSAIRPPAASLARAFAAGPLSLSSALGTALRGVLCLRCGNISATCSRNLAVHSAPYAVQLAPQRCITRCCRGCQNFAFCAAPWSLVQQRLSEALHQARQAGCRIAQAPSRGSHPSGAPARQWCRHLHSLLLQARGR